MRVTIVDACVRPGGSGEGSGSSGGSPTAIVFDDGTMTDDERRTVPPRSGTSHAAFVGPEADGTHPVRFFTTEGELTGCGHGTIAAHAARLAEAGLERQDGRQRTGGRTFEVQAVARAEGIEVWFDQGVIAVRPATADECGAVLVALGIGADHLHPYVRMAIAAPETGTPRLLVAVADRDVLAALTPDMTALGAATRERGLLGCFVCVPPDQERSAVARMFAPAIGVDEDVANANSTGCLAAHLLCDGPIEVEQGDALGRPATVYATAHSGPSGVRVRVGGLAVVRGPR
jgi:PhzF family phenazine biosynthesis protein